VRAGVSEQIAMTLSGHRTRSVFDRYNITSSADQREAVQKLVAMRASVIGASTPSPAASLEIDPKGTSISSGIPSAQSRRPGGAIDCSA